MATHTSAALLVGVIALVTRPQPSPSSHKLEGVTFLRDTYHSGNGKILGTVKESGTPDLAVRRRVRLHRKIDGMLIREVWSADDGSYAFLNVAIQPYYVTSHDHTGNYNAVIKDSIVPVVMS